MPSPLGPISAAGQAADSAGALMVTKAVAQNHFALIYASCTAGETAEWIMGKSNAQLFFQQGAQAVMGPLLLGPNEPAQITITGLAAAEIPTIELWGWLGDANSPDGSELAPFWSNLLTAGSITGTVDTTPTSGSAMVKIDRRTGNTGIVFDPVPVIYSNLMLVVREGPASVLTTVLISYSNDFANHYVSEVLQAQGGPGAASATPIAATFGGRIGSADTGRGGSQTVMIHDYASQTATEVLSESFGGAQGFAGGISESNSWLWVKPLPTDQVTRIDVYLSAGNALITADLYGLT